MGNEYVRRGLAGRPLGWPAVEQRCSPAAAPSSGSRTVRFANLAAKLASVPH